MTTVNATISNYYVIDNLSNTVVAINPTEKEISFYYQRGLRTYAEIELPYLETHNAVGTLNVTGAITSFMPDYQVYDAYAFMDLKAISLNNQEALKVGDYVSIKDADPDGVKGYTAGYHRTVTGTSFIVTVNNKYRMTTYNVVGSFTGEKNYYSASLTGLYNTYSNQKFNSLALSIDYTEATSFEGNLYPQGSFVDYTKELNFSVELTKTQLSTLYQIPIMESGILYYKKQSESIYRSVSFTGYTGAVPANTFENGYVYDVYAVLTSRNGHTLTTPSVTYTTVDSIPSVEGISPSNQITNGDINFTWNYTNETGTSQYAFDIQYSADQSTWTTLANHVVSSSTNYQGSISTLGTLYWRVRGYNQNNVAGAWSTPLMFINRVAPNAPVIISVTQSGRPFINWSATGQTAFEIVVENIEGNTVFESGIIPSTANQYLINEYLPNGQYLIKLKIQNVFGDESDYATYHYFQNIDYSQIGYPVFNLQVKDNGVMINITHDDTFSYYYLKRNGITIAKITDDKYLDKFANGITEYTLLGVTSTDLFSSTTNTIDATVKFTRLIGLDGTVFDIHERRGAPVDIQKSYEVDFEEAQYLGARLPEINTSKFRRRTYTVAFYYPQDLEVLMGETFLYADVYGNRDWVVLVGANKLERRAGNDISVQLNTCNYSEGIEYDL